VPDDAPGWDAIDAALRPVVEDRVPDHWGAGTGLPDQDGLWGVSAYRFEDHVLYVTYGLTELFTKVSDDAAVSGWGAELTMRVVPPLGDGPPTWPVRLLARLGELVFRRATPFMPGGRMDVPDGGAELPAALAWIEDPQLGPVLGPFGRFEFVATVGISSELIGEMRKTTTAGVFSRVRASNPLLITGGPRLRW
jgi:suppressor of fused